MIRRSSGILLHITSLPSRFGIGDLGPSAYAFVDLLEKAKQTYWQVLPLNPIAVIYGNSPYSSCSAFAGNPLLISPEELSRDGLLVEQRFRKVPQFGDDRVDYAAVLQWKKEIFEAAFACFKESKDKTDFDEFCASNHYWLNDFALFVTLKEHFEGRPWTQWPDPAKKRDLDFLKEFQNTQKEKIEKEKFLQYVFFKQWKALRAYAQKKKVDFIGDIPIYVNDDSADVWAHQELFKLNQDQKPLFVAGVPPDYFSKTGQRWGNPRL
ncbi:MAG: 4-alpha-glucanotransferase [Candidatus Omnitrophota bacterium]